MSKHGRTKWAFFEDGVLFETERTNHLKRRVKERREIEGYKGRVWFRYTDEWRQASAERMRKAGF